MKVLVVAPTYPFPAHPFSGIFNERSVQALKKICETVEVLAPRPYVPPLLSLVRPRWRAYTAVSPYEIRDGIVVHRPAIPVVPQVGGALWLDQSAFLWSCQTAEKMHRRANFDAILSFDLVGAGGLAWRIGKALGIPASGWATGGDIRVAAPSSFGKVVIRALRNLNLVFYQSQELLEKAADLLGIAQSGLPPDKHMVLARGIVEPPPLDREMTRKRLRQELGLTDDKILVLSIGRITREKGIFELIEAFFLAAKEDGRLRCVMVGSLPAFDETASVQKDLNNDTYVRGKAKILPTCAPNEVWQYLCAADLFAFTSHREGMPNSLLEAMAMGLPAIAFGIPPVLEIESGTGALVTVPPFNSTLFAETILRFAASPDERRRIGDRGRSRVFDRFMVQKNMAVALKRLAQSRTRSSNNRN